MGVMNNMTDYAMRQRMETRSMRCKHKQLFEWVKIYKPEDFLNGGANGNGSCCKNNDQI
jgi:hypothetical protein